METREPHLTTAHVALICSALGWVSGGLIAIPGVIIAHTIHSREPGTAVAVKAALRVGYGAILVGIAGVMAVVLTYLGLVARLRWLLAGKQGFPEELQGSGGWLAEGNGAIPESWAWTGGVFLVTVIGLILILPWIRKGYATFQSFRILRGNSAR